MVWLCTAMVAAALAFAAAAAAQTAPAPPVPAPSPAATPAPRAPSAEPDYRRASDWLCRPGAEGACAVDLNAMGVEASGARRPVPFQAASDAQIDCFYVYPTVSQDPGALSDLEPGPEERRAVRGQFARLAAQCRLFAPVYRQITLAGLGASLRGDRSGGAVDFDTPYRDVLAAWRDYLRHDNNGRGVVLIGHSQGAILLSRLLKEEIDGEDAQRLLVAAYLAGHPGFAVPQGRDVGGDLQSIPLCRAPNQTGCVLAWSAYRAEDQTPSRFFGRSRVPGQVAACVSPASVGGGRGTLHGYFSRPAGAPETDPPFVVNLSGVTGECVRDDQGAVLRVSVDPGTPVAPFLTAALQRAESIPGWGLHSLDVSLVMGDVVDLVGRQAEAWRAARRP